MTTTNQIPELDPVASEARRAKRERLLGEDAACLLCGLANIDTLTLVSRSVLDAHHVVGRANDDELTTPLCRNCHAEVTEGYRDAGVPLNRPPTILHKLAAILRALGNLLSALGRKLSAWAETLIRLIQRLDAELPAWRSVEGAHP
jgi:hypothetical protein